MPARRGEQRRQAEPAGDQVRPNAAPPPPPRPCTSGTVPLTTSTASRRYRRVDTAGVPTYVEHHRTLGDRIRDVAAAGLVLDDLVEPEWPEGRETVWGQWSPLRGALFPGTAIFVCRRP